MRKGVTDRRRTLPPGRAGTRGNASTTITRRQHTYSPELMPTESKQLLCQQWKKSRDMTIHPSLSRFRSPGAPSFAAFRGGWDTAGLALKPVAGPTAPCGCPTFAPAYVGRKRGRSPPQLFVFSHLPDGSGFDMCITCNYVHSLAKMIQVRNVPDALHRSLKARAAMAGMSLSDYLLGELREIAERPTLAEFRERLHKRKSLPVALDTSGLLREERTAR
jgi:plasmid stability protein